MLKAHQKQGGLFTIEPSYAASTELALDEVSKAVSAKMMEPMTAPMMALSLLSNTSFLIDHGVMNLTLPRLPLMYPGDPTAQDKCLEAVDMVFPSCACCYSCATVGPLNFGARKTCVSVPASPANIRIRPNNVFDCYNIYCP